MHITFKTVGDNPLKTGYLTSNAQKYYYEIFHGDTRYNYYDIFCSFTSEFT